VDGVTQSLCAEVGARNFARGTSDREYSYRSLKTVAALSPTPLFLFTPRTLEARARELVGIKGWGARWTACYMVKTNWAPPVVKMICREGIGAAVSNSVELAIAHQAGASAEQLIAVGPAKSDLFLRDCVDLGLRFVMLETIEEARALSAIASQRGRSVSVGLRVSSGIEAHTRDYLLSWPGQRRPESKFGVAWSEALAIALEVNKLPHLALSALSTNLGSQICSVEVFRRGLRSLIHLASKLAGAGCCITHFDIGGGLPVEGLKRRFPTPYSLLTKALLGKTAFTVLETPSDECQPRSLIPYFLECEGLPAHATLIVEPGRWLAAGAMELLCSVVRTSRRSGRRWIYLDGGIDLLPDAGFGEKRLIRAIGRNSQTGRLEPHAVAGPSCMKADVLTRDVMLPCSIDVGDFMLIGSAGAYGFSRSSWFGGALPAVVETAAHESSPRILLQGKPNTTLFESLRQSAVLQPSRQISELGSHIDA